MVDITCSPKKEQLPVTYKVYQLAARLGGENPDGKFDPVTLDLGNTDPNSPVVRLENLIGYQRGTTTQSNPIARHWGETKKSIGDLMKNLGVTTITEQSLEKVPAQYRRNAAILIDSTAILMHTMALETVCSAGPLVRTNATPAEVKSELPAIYNGPNLYIRMGGEDDDGGLPEATISTPLTFTDDDLRLIDNFLGYTAGGDAPNPDNMLLSDWHEVRKNILAIRKDNVVTQDALPTNSDQSRIAAVILNSWAGVLRILRSPDWQAGRAYGMTAEVTSKNYGGSVTDTFTISSGDGYMVKAPEGGWKVGDQILVDDNPLSTVIAGGNAPFTIPADKLPQGERTIKLKRGAVNTSLVQLNVVGSDISTWILGGLLAAASLFGLGMFVQSLRAPKPVAPNNSATPIAPVAPTTPTAPKAAPTAVDAETTTVTPEDPLIKALAEATNPAPMAKSKAIKPTFYIGRETAAGSDIALDTSNLEPVMKNMISGKHVGVESENGVFRVVDQGRNPDIAMVERNGVAFKMSRDAKSPTVLKDGDILDIGGSRMVFTGSMNDPANPMSAFAQAKNVLFNQSLIIQPIAAAASNGTNGKTSKPTEEDVRQKLLRDFPPNMRSADGKGPHSDYTDRFDDMVKKVMNDPKLTAASLDLIATRTVETSFREWGNNKGSYSFDLRMKYYEIAGQAELRAKEAKPAEAAAK